MQHKERIGGFLFDGTQLFLTRELETDRGKLTLDSKTRTDEAYKLTLKFTKVVQMHEQESLQILNLILRRATQGMKLQLVGRNYYDAQSKVCYTLFDTHQIKRFLTNVLLGDILRQLKSN